MNPNMIPTLSLVAFETNSLSDGIPRIWSTETLRILVEKMTIGNVVHRDFSEDLREFGDIVQVQRPNQYTAKRKSDEDDVQVQNSVLSNINVPLDQHIHTSFRIRDRQLSLNIHDLTRLFLNPAAVSLARKIDRILLGQVYRFRTSRDPVANNVVGDLGGLSVTNVKSQMLQLRKKFLDNRVPDDQPWWAFITPGTEATILELDLMNAADQVGDRGEALRRALLGQKFGFLWEHGQNVSEIVGAGVATVQADELASDVAPGDTVITVDLGTGFAVGEYITIEGDLQPYRITGISGNDLTISPPARRTILASASDIQQTLTGLVDLAGHTGVSAYPAGYDKEIKVDGTGVPQVGQLVSFNTAGTPNVALAGEYAIVDVNTVGGTFIELDRPLQTAIADNDVVGYGHSGAYNFALHPEAMTMVIRPPETVPGGMGAVSNVASFGGMALRTTMAYEALKQSILVTMDVLMGVQVLEENYAVPFLA